MPKSPQSPIFRFLSQKENLPGVLEVINYAEEIRGYVADHFWNRLEQAIKENPKASASFSWMREFADKGDGCFELIARPQALSERAQGLRYTIEMHREYIGMGLHWNEDPKTAVDVKKLHLSPGHRQLRLRGFAISLPHLAEKFHGYSSSLPRPVFRNERVLPFRTIVHGDSERSSCSHGPVARQKTYAHHRTPHSGAATAIRSVRLRSGRAGRPGAPDKIRKKFRLRH
jgi:hypothetical protein